MEQFSLEKYLENPNRKVVTRDGRPARIVCWNMKSMSPIVGIIQDRLGGEFIRSYTLNGRYSTKNESEYDLFFAEEEEKSQSIEIPFGAKDSEFIKDEYLIPEGCEARIEGNKVIIEKIQKEDELTEFEKKVLEISGKNYNYVPSIKVDAQILLDLARKELFKEQEHCVVVPENDYYEQLSVQYQKGKQDVLKSLPKWKKAEKDEELDCHVAIQQDGRVVLSDFVQKDEYYITLDVLKKLPKE